MVVACVFMFFALTMFICNYIINNNNNNNNLHKFSLIVDN